MGWRRLCSTFAGPVPSRMALPTTLAEWLAHCERLHPKEIDLTLERVRTVKATLGMRFEAPLVIVAGTNGKGSTCAMLESIALHAGYRVGLYLQAAPGAFRGALPHRRRAWSTPTTCCRTSRRSRRRAAASA